MPTLQFPSQIHIHIITFIFVCVQKYSIKQAVHRTRCSHNSISFIIYCMCCVSHLHFQVCENAQPCPCFSYWWHIQHSVNDVHVLHLCGKWQYRIYLYISQDVVSYTTIPLRQRYYDAENLQQLFKEISITSIFDFLGEIRLFYRIQVLFFS